MIFVGNLMPPGLFAVKVDGAPLYEIDVDDIPDNVRLVLADVGHEDVEMSYCGGVVVLQTRDESQALAWHEALCKAGLDLLGGELLGGTR